MDKFDLVKALFELIENHGSEFGINLNQNPDELESVSEIEITYDRKKYVIEVKGNL